MTSRLSLRARKSFIRELTAALSLSGSTESAVAGIKTWAVSVSGNLDSFSVVWLQGYVTQVDDGTDSFHMSDGTGTAVISNVSAVPRAFARARPDQYLMVVGELYEVTSTPVVRAMKIQDLTEDKELSQQMWPWEVRDAHQCLTLAS